MRISLNYVVKDKELNIKGIELKVTLTKEKECFLDGNKFLNIFFEKSGGLGEILSGTWADRVYTAFMKTDEFTGVFDREFYADLKQYSYKQAKKEFKEVENKKETVIEFCPFCDKEVEILAENKMQVCPICKNDILPCSMCEDKECRECKQLDNYIKEIILLAKEFLKADNEKANSILNTLMSLGSMRRYDIFNWSCDFLQGKSYKVDEKLYTHFDDFVRVFKKYEEENK